MSHSLRGLCGLKSPGPTHLYGQVRHSLRGLCGLKYRLPVHYPIPLPSQPARAVWIEIFNATQLSTFCHVTACEGCVD